MTLLKFNEMRRFRDEILRAQLRPVLALALAAALTTALVVLLQYLSVRVSGTNPVDELKPEELRLVLVDAQPAQWPQLARWLVQYGLNQKIEGSSNALLTDGQRVPVHRLVQLIRDGQRIDPISLQTLGPAPVVWIEAIGSAGWQRVAAQPEGAHGRWRALLLDLSGGQRLLLQAPEFELSALDLAQTIAFIFGIIFALTGSFVGLFLWLFRRHFASTSAARLTLPLERLAAAFTRFATDQSQPTILPIEPPLELAQLAHSANLLQERLSTSLRELAKVNEDQRSFMAEISHELRTPLTVIRGHAERIGRESSQAENAAIIMRQVEDLHQLLSDLIDLNQIASISAHMRIEAVSVTALLTEMHARFQASAWRQGVLLRLDKTVHGLSVQADARWLRQVFANLLVNAIRHTPEGGWITLSFTQQAEQAHIRIDDTGIGMQNAPATDDYSGRGAGIGLRVVRSLLGAMNAKLRSEVNDDGGTAMVVIVDLC
jgi:signal transduction histidine kinase